MKLLDALFQRRDSATAEMFDLARKEASGKATRADADRLGALLVDADTERAAAYRRMVDTCARHAELRALGDKLDAREKAAADVREKIEAHKREAGRIEEARRAKLFDLLARQASADAELREAEVAACELGDMELQHPQLLGVEAKDLDRYELHAFGEILEAPGFPVLRVGNGILLREKARRGRVRQAAIRLAKQEHNAAVSEWNAKRENFGTPYPTAFEAPEWPEIVSRGWHQTLADEEPEPEAPTSGRRSIPITATA